MSYQWSRNAAHIQSLFAPWKIEDGWDETSVGNTEQVLSIKFPPILRNYYLSWGRRFDYNHSNETLLDPKETFVHLGHLVFCIENQAVNYWGIPLNQFNQPDPTVNYIYNDETDTEWKPSHKSLTAFLDALVYSHAFADHGVSAQVPEERLSSIEILVKDHYSEIQLDSSPWGIPPSVEFSRWTLYGKPGIAIEIDFTTLGLFATAQSDEVIQVLENLIGLRCKKAW